MTEWFLPPNCGDESGEPSDAEISAALEALLSITSVDTFHSVMEKWLDVLLSERALFTICLTIARAHIQGEREFADFLEDSLSMLEYAQTRGIATVLDEILSLQDGIQQDMTDNEVAITLPRRIKLLTLVLTCVTHMSHASIWAELHRERANTYMKLAAVADQAENTELAIADYDAALTVFTSDSAPQSWARTHILRGLAYKERLSGEQAENIERAIADFTNALNTFTLEETPLEWAVIHVERGLVYTYRQAGDRDDNLEQAIADFNAALQFISHQNMPPEWAKILLYRIDAYTQRSRGITETEKHEQAIVDYTAALEVLTFEDAPGDWLQAHGRRGVAYMEHTQGDHTQNLALALDDFNACLEIPIRDTYSTTWAHAHRARGLLYIEYTQSNQSEYIERAIADFDAALEVFTRENFPLDWAQTHLNRGTAYRERSYTEQARNLEQAIAEFDSALEILTRENAHEEWADAYLNRGLSYTERMYGDHATNIERAIVDLSEALSVFTRESFPYKYALTHINLGFAYIERIRGQRTTNIEQAIEFLDTALQILTREANPREWAMAHLDRGLAYAEYPLGERSGNLELAVQDYDAALTVYTRETLPIEWAKTGLNRTLAYSQRMMEYYKENLDHAINDYNAILEVFTEAATPRYWAMARMNRGLAYLNRSLGSKAENIEQALADFNAALTVFNRETMLQSWVLAHLDCGVAYSQRMRGEPSENLSHAIAEYDTILEVLSQEQMPYHWAMSCKGRAAAYLDCIDGNLGEHCQPIIADCQAAMTVLTREAFPRDYRDLQLMLARVYEEQGYWQQVHTAMEEVHKTTHTLIEAATNEERRREVLGEREKSSNYLRYAQALLHREPPDVAAAACALEDGRAQNLRLALDLDAITLEKLEKKSDPAARARAEAFIAARDAWREAQRLVTDTVFINLSPGDTLAENVRRRPQLRTAHQAFTQARDAIRQHDDPNFLEPHTRLEDIARAIPTPNAALVYLAAREQGGLALMIMNTEGTTPRLEHISLPKLSRKAVLDLLMGTHELPALKLMQTPGGPQEYPFMSGGLWLAQLGRAFALLTMWGENIHAAMQALPRDCTYLEAARQLMQNSADNPTQRELLNQPFAALSIDELLALEAAFDQLVINLELKHALPVLGDLGLNEVAQHLQKWGIQDVTLIPYEYLNFFPFPAVLIRQLNGQTQRLSDLFAITVAPSARAKEMALSRASALDRAARPLLLTVGNPQPLPQDVNPLPYAQAEADTIRRIAEAFQYPFRYLHSKEATRERTVEALAKTWYAHLAIHGQYDLAEPQRSRLVLAGNESLLQDQRHIYLSEALDGMVNLVGLRLLVLSACETALIDTRYAPDEVLGLATGFLQAGAAGVIASLWAVDDRATYLLMSRFAQLYLNPQFKLSPARALAEAQRWLREEATNKLLMNYDPLQEMLVDAKPALVQSAITEAPTNNERKPIASGTRSLRLTHKRGLAEVRSQAATQEPDELPYADPIYWAGFVVTGC